MEEDVSSPTFELNNQIIRAGAGAGKTYTLTNHVLDVAEEFHKVYNRYPNIVISTFTVKATQELRERLMLKALERNNFSLLEYISSKSLLHISTIHGVLSSFLTRYSQQLNLDSSFEIKANSEILNKAKSQIRDLVFESEKYQELLELMTYESLSSLLLQYYEASLEYPKVEIVDKKFLLDSLDHELDLYGQTAKKLIIALSSSLQNFLQENKVTKTTDSWNQYIFNLGQIVKVIDDEKCIKKLKDFIGSVARLPNNSAKNPIFSEDLHKRNKNFWNDFKKEVANELRNEEILQKLSSCYDIFSELAQEFIPIWRDFKEKMGQLAMSDLELLCLDAVRNFPSTVLAFSKEWDYWLIDEFQDTSPIQIEILNAFMQEKPRFYVGDPQQSIYLFRGSEVSVFKKMEQHLQNTGGNLRSLLKNYRSDPECLEFFNYFFKEQEFSSMEPKLNSFNRCKEVAHYIKLEKEEEENTAIVNEIIQLKKDGVELGNICILARKNFHLLQIAEALKNANIAANLHISGNFKEKREVQDLIALVQFLMNPYDNKNLIQLLRSPYFKVEDQVLISICGKEHMYWTKLGQDYAENEVVLYLKNLLNLRKEIGIYQCLLKSVRERGIIDASHYHDSSGKRESNIWKFLQDLSTNEHKQGFSYLDYIKQSAANLDVDKAEGDSEAIAALEPNRVNLMTIHRSKGLQFDYVFIPRCHEAPQSTKSLSSLTYKQKYFLFSLPISSEQKSIGPLELKKQTLQLREKELEESKRLMYVALTRAVKKVYLTWNTEAKKNSWVDIFNMDFQEEAVLGFDKFSVKYGLSCGERLTLEERLYREKDIPDLFNMDKSIAKQNFSVSELISQTKKNEKQYDFKELPSRIEKAQFGTIMHKIFEILHYQPDMDWYELVADSYPEKKDLIQEAVQFVFNYERLNFKDLIRKGYVEFGFILLQNAKRLEGQIDLWGMVDGEIYIVDYKTGNQAYAEQAFTQLNLYALALRKLDYKENINLVVVYPFSKYVEVRQAMKTEDIVNRFFLS